MGGLTALSFMRWILILLLVLLVADVSAQKQLIILSRESVIGRFSEGDYLRCKLRNGKRTEGRILELEGFTILTSSDTFKTTDLAKVRMPRGRVQVNRGIGGLLFVGGIGYFAIDELNTLVVKGTHGVNKNVAITSLSMAAVGAALLFIRPKYTSVWNNTIRIIDYTSPFYSN